MSAQPALTMARCRPAGSSLISFLADHLLHTLFWVWTPRGILCPVLFLPVGGVLHRDPQHQALSWHLCWKERQTEEVWVRIFNLQTLRTRRDCPSSPFSLRMLTVVIVS